MNSKFSCRKLPRSNSGTVARNKESRSGDRRSAKTRVVSERTLSSVNAMPNRDWFEIRCEHCERGVVIRHHTRNWGRIRFCSATCRNAFRNTKRREQRRLDRPSANVCVHCGNVFEIIRRDPMYCSPRCRQATYRARLKQQIDNETPTEVVSDC